MLDELRDNIKIEQGLLRELVNFLDKLERSKPEDAELIKGIVESVKKRLKLTNDTIPELLKHVTVSKRFNKIKSSNLKSVSVNDRSAVSVKSRDVEKFLSQLNLSKDLIKRLRERESKKERVSGGIQKPGTYAKTSNRFFLNTSQDWIDNGRFKSLLINLRKSNINVLSSTYISMMFFTVFISIILGILLFIFLLFFSVGFGFPFITMYEGDFLMRMLKTSWIIVAVPIATWAMFYLYPGTEKSSIGKKIDKELPFMVIQMGSIAGSGIEPVEIFKIIGLSGDYKHASKEVRKLLNQINVYGYDLVTSLTNVAHSTPSVKLSELFGGLAIAISSGGDLKTFFEKRSDTLLLGYSLEREKFTKVAETFMDIYISVVIATPMILLLLLIMISVSGVSLGIGIGNMSFLIILVVAVINVLFLIFLHIKQPTY